MAETGERALLDILSQHLEVTQKLLGNFIDLVWAIRHSPDISNRLPTAELPKLPALQELRTSTSELLGRVQSTLDLK
jgi:hypothetical protein